MANNVKKVWASGKAVVNAWLAIPSGFSAEVIAQCGFDSVTVDIQHGVQDYQSMVQCFQAMHAHPVTPMVRVPWNEPGIIGKVLDGGAFGIICPMINTKQEAENLVSYSQVSADRHALERSDPFRHVWFWRHLSEDRQRRDRAAADDGDQDRGREHENRSSTSRASTASMSVPPISVSPTALSRSLIATSRSPQDLREDRQGMRQARALSRHPLQRRRRCGEGIDMGFMLVTLPNDTA